MPILHDDGTLSPALGSPSPSFRVMYGGTGEVLYYYEGEWLLIIDTEHLDGPGRGLLRVHLGRSLEWFRPDLKQYRPLLDADRQRVIKNIEEATSKDLFRVVFTPGDA